MRAAVAKWERFWFEPEETSALALFRIAFGLVVLAWSLTLTHDAYDFFSEDGVLPRQPDFDGPFDAGLWGVLGIFPSKGAVAALLAILIAGAVALIVGYRTRLAALLVFVCLLSLQRRNVFVFNSGDGLLKIIAFYLVFAPAGASLSVDRLRAARDRFWEFPARAPWVVRLLQIQLSVIYLSMVWAKVRGTTWGDGTAVSYAMRIEDLQRLHLPQWVVDSSLVTSLMTYGTLGVELALGILVWNRKLRPWVLLLGVGLHLGIDLTLRVGFFSYAMLTLYIAFLPPEVVSRRLLALRDRLSAGLAARTAASAVLPSLKASPPAGAPSRGDEASQPPTT